jgi:hypothetical protein
MKALLINEVLNFDRSGGPLDKMNVGMGPEKYIKTFEKILELSDIKYKLISKDNNDGMLIWDIDVAGFSWEVHLVDKGVFQNLEHRGWRLVGVGGYEKDPFNLLKTIINSRWRDMDEDIKKVADHLEDTKNHLAYLEKMAEKVEEAKELIENKTII